MSEQWTKVARASDLGGGDLLQVQAGPERSALVNTHYMRVLEFLQPDMVHVMHEGRRATLEGYCPAGARGVLGGAGAGVTQGLPPAERPAQTLTRDQEAAA